MVTRLAGPNPISAMCSAQRVARREGVHAEAAVDAPASRDSGAVMVVLVLEERREQHTRRTPNPQRGDPYPPDCASARLTALRLISERRGAIATERHQRAPTNVARNYYDGGRDFAIEHTLQLSFASIDAAVGLLTAAKPALVAWLAPRRAHTATLYVDAAELALRDDDDLDRALILLARIADASLRPTRRDTR